MARQAIENSEHLGIKVSKSLKADFSALAAKRGKSVSQMIREIMESKVKMMKSRNTL